MNKKEKEREEMGMKKGACIRKFQLSINTNLPMVILVLIALTLSVNYLTI